MNQTLVQIYIYRTRWTLCLYDKKWVLYIFDSLCWKRMPKTSQIWYNNICIYIESSKLQKLLMNTELSSTMILHENVIWTPPSHLFSQQNVLFNCTAAPYTYTYIIIYSQLYKEQTKMGMNPPPKGILSCLWFSPSSFFLFLFSSKINSLKHMYNQTQSARSNI